MTSAELAVIQQGVETLVRRLLAEPLLRLKALEMGPAPRDGRDGLPGVPGAPGVAGKAGPAGRDGVDGTPGRDGTLEGLQLSYDGDRTLTWCRADGSILGALRLPIPLPYREGATYEAGDVVIGSKQRVWRCLKATTLRPTHVSRDDRGQCKGPQGKDFWEPLE